MRAELLRILEALAPQTGTIDVSDQANPINRKHRRPEYDTTTCSESHAFAYVSVCAGFLATTWYVCNRPKFRTADNQKEKDPTRRRAASMPQLFRTSTNLSVKIKSMRETCPPGFNTRTISRVILSRSSRFSVCVARSWKSRGRKNCRQTANAGHRLP